MKKSRLFFFSEYYYPAQNSTALYLTGIANIVAQAFSGVVHLYCNTCNDPGFETLEEPDNLKVHRICSGKWNKNSLWQRLLGFSIVSLLFSFHAICRVRKRDVVFSVTNPAFMVLLLALLKKIYRFKFILLAYDIFPENILAAGLSSRDSLKYKLAQKAFDWAYCQADQVVSIGCDMTNVLQAKGVMKENIVKIPNWADTERVIPESKKDNEYIRQFNLENKKVFFFAGNFGRVQGFVNLLEAITISKSSKAAFLFIGDGAMSDTLESYIKKYPTKNVYRVGYQPLSRQNSIQNSGDVALVSLGRNMLGLGVPSKSYFSMAAAKPILYIGEQESEIGQVVINEKIGWQVVPGKPEALAEQIDMIAEMPEQCLKEMGERAREICKNYFSEKIILHKYYDLIQDITREKETT